VRANVEFSGHGGQLRLDGDMSFDNVDELSRKALSLLKETDSPGLDFAGLRSFDSSVLVFLLSLVKQVRVDGKALVLSRASDKLKALMKAYGLEGLLNG